MKNVRERFDSLKLDISWSFLDKLQIDTNYITHGYYTYPAKFIPQLARRLILEYSKDGDVVLDPFMGSGTAMVESLVNTRKCVCIDINEIAYLSTKVKITPLDIDSLEKEYFILQESIYYFDSMLESENHIEADDIHERID